MIKLSNAIRECRVENQLIFVWTETESVAFLYTVEEHPIQMPLCIGTPTTEQINL